MGKVLDPSLALDAMCECIFDDVDYDMAYQFSEELRVHVSQGRDPDWTQARQEKAIDCLLQMASELGGQR